MQKTDLSIYNNHPYHPGGSKLKRFAWYYVNILFFKSALFPFYAPKVFLLRTFGAKIGKKVELKPCVNIKYPWNLTIGDEVWIGENVWLDSLVMITIGSNVCLSQGATLLTGSHNYKKNSFDLITGGITLEDGVWIGAGAIVNQGVTAHSHAVLTSGSVATKNMEAYSIYQGNPAVKVRERVIE
ncbi:MAG TPA: WcaF family extracellular polysaccharide biosynthesis acetyltransferase [Mucilaginibacter sp.]|nr:WcaF family extracellular polysaccharide biosynthesis acetyltransferase [Mucilaginibacter sp.]